MTHQKFVSPTHNVIELEGDWNSLIDHGLRSGWSYLVYYDSADSVYKAVNGVDKTLHATTSADAAVVRNAVRASLVTAGEGVIRFLDYPYQTN